MSNFKQEKSYPIGLGKEAGPEEKLSAVEVKNEVVWVNKEVEMPFDLKEGKPTKLGVFLTYNPGGKGRILNVGIMDEHFRSALLGKVIFQDKEGRLYRDVDIKGIGPIGVRRWETREGEDATSRMGVEPLEFNTAQNLPRGSMPWGFYDYAYAENDREMSEFFVRKGLRTSRVLAIVDLKEIVGGDGNKISITEAKKRKYINTTTDPVVEIRAFGTKARIANRNDKKFLEDGKAMVAQELGKDPKMFTNKEYLTWFAKTLGEQVALLHNEGYQHNYLTSHNITLDCRIVDLDSVAPFSEKTSQRYKAIFKDLDDVLTSFQLLGLYSFEGIDEKSGKNFLEQFVPFQEMFWKSYLHAFKNQDDKRAVVEYSVEKHEASL